MPVITVKPTQVISREFAREILKIMGDTRIYQHKEITWREVSIDTIQKFAYNVEEFQDAIWDNDISISCPEPFKFHIKTWSYICDELWNGQDSVVGFRRDVSSTYHYEPVIKYRVLGKWDYRELDEEGAERKDTWFIHTDDLLEYVEAELVEWDNEDAIEALEAWNDAQSGINRDEFSEAELERLEQKIELWNEVQADIIRGK